MWWELPLVLAAVAAASAWLIRASVRALRAPSRAAGPRPLRRARRP